MMYVTVSILIGNHYISTSGIGKYELSFVGDLPRSNGEPVLGFSYRGSKSNLTINCRHGEQMKHITTLELEARKYTDWK